MGIGMITSVGKQNTNNANKIYLIKFDVVTEPASGRTMSVEGYFYSSLPLNTVSGIQSYINNKGFIDSLSRRYMPCQGVKQYSTYSCVALMRLYVDNVLMVQYSLSGMSDVTTRTSGSISNVSCVEV